MAKQTSTDISEGIINDLEVEIKQKNKNTSEIILHLISFSTEI